MVSNEVFADSWMHAGQTTARALGTFILAGHLVHVGRGPAALRAYSREARRPRELANLAKHARLASPLDDSPLVLGDAAEGAAAETPPHRYDRVLYRVEGRNPLGIRRMR